MTDSQPLDPVWPRYSTEPLPAYRFLPGKTPHPRRDPRGHSYGQSEPERSAFHPDNWHQSTAYLYAIDLFNFAYWWECHEVFEGLWHAVGEDTEHGNCFQALIQLAAAHLKRFVGREEAAQKLVRSALARLQTLPHHYMGINILELCEIVQDDLAHPGEVRLLLRLSGPSNSENQTRT